MGAMTPSKKEAPAGAIGVPKRFDIMKSQKVHRKHHTPTRCSARGSPMKSRRMDGHRRRHCPITNELERGYIMNADID